MFTLPDTDTDKMGCTELFGGVHTAQRQTSTEIPIGLCVNLSVSVSVSVSDSVNTPELLLYLKTHANTLKLLSVFNQLKFSQYK